MSGFLHRPAVVRVLRPMALVVTDRRWAAPLSALALGFGLFVGVAIGPGVAGTQATGARVIELPEPEGEAESPPQTALGPPASGGSGSSEAPEPEAFPSGSLEAGGPETALPESEPPTKKPESKIPAGEEEEPEAPVTEGIVVHANPAAGSFVVAEPGGILNTIHAAKLPAAGSELSVETRTLANGTLAEEAKPAVKAGGKRQATVVGVVTFVDPDPASPAYTLSARGASLLVGVHPEASGAVPVLPVLGANAEVKVEIEPVAAGAEAPPTAAPAPGAAPVVTIPPQGTTCLADPANAAPAPPLPEARLWQAGYKAEPTPFTYSDIEGIVEAVCPATDQLLISADDMRAAGADLTLTVPNSIEATGVTVGESVATTAEIAADGTMTLSGLASDERLAGADDAKAAQGDLKP